MGACIIPVFAITTASLIGFTKTAFGLGFVIFVHELGHFLVAKACGVKCEKFYIGFDAPISLGPVKLPASLFKRQWGETEYGIGIIPLGGYVKMLGQDDNPANAQREADRIRVPQDPTDDSTIPVSARPSGPFADADPKPASDTTLDPRSYPAKSVPQRMAIISAGVIMNLIFAVVFATWAYYLGVKYTPCAIGSAQPGSPGWEAGLVPGDFIVQLGKDLPKSESLRFDVDLSYRVVKAGLSKPLDLLVRRANGSEEWISIRPQLLHKADKQDRPRIGIAPGYQNQILVAGESPLSAATDAGLKDNDELVAVEIDGNRKEVTNPIEFQALLARYPDKTLTVTVKRPPSDPAKPQATNSPVVEGQEVTVQLKPQPFRSLGMAMEMGPVESLRRGSPAESAGIQLGDVLLAIDGAPISDPMYAEQQLLPKIGGSVTIRVARQAIGEPAAEIDLTVVPEAPPMRSDLLTPGKPTALETIGLAFAVTDTVRSVDPEGPAAKVGVLPGDIVQRVEFVAAQGDPKVETLLKTNNFNDPTWAFTEEQHDWSAFVVAPLQLAPAGTDIKLSIKRAGKLVTATVPPQLETTHWNTNRGMEFRAESKIRKADNLAMAVELGLRETKEGVLQVVDILRNIRSLFKNVGGPLAIAAIGTQEASKGLPALLIFLTMLSANLAVLNFLPIPVLDGGHMVFLAYEGIMGKPVNERVAISLTIVGMALLLSLMVFVIGKDILMFAGA